MGRDLPPQNTTLLEKQPLFQQPQQIPSVSTDEKYLLWHL